MAAIRPFREEVEDEGAPSGAAAPVAPADAAPFGDFGAVASGPAAAESQMAEFTRLVWIRQELGKVLGAHQYEIGPAPDGRASFFLLDKRGRRVNPAPEAIPWYNSPKGALGFAFFTSNTKMHCPTFDLPAGAPVLRGTCPNASAGQIIVPPPVRERAADSMRPPPGYALEEHRASVHMSRDHICNSCYATGGQFPSPGVQVGEMLRHQWARACMGSEAGREEFVTTMVDAVVAEGRKPSRHGIRPFRIHSSGDFFSPSYFAAWAEIARRVAAGRDPLVRFWAPTRVWGQPGYDWELLSSMENFVVRPSAYSMGDRAPEAMVKGNARGTTAIYHDDNRGMAPAAEERALRHQPEAVQRELQEHFKAVRARRGGAYEDRADWTCQAYAVSMGGDDLANSCEEAIDPGGERGCRACWLARNLRICYTAH